MALLEKVCSKIRTGVDHDGVECYERSTKNLRSSGVRSGQFVYVYWSYYCQTITLCLKCLTIDIIAISHTSQSLVLLMCVTQ